MNTIEHSNRSVNRAGKPRQVCDHCSGTFGLVTHRWWGRKFCRRRCKDAYLREIALDRDTALRWCGLLGVISHSWHRNEVALARAQPRSSSGSRQSWIQRS